MAENMRFFLSWIKQELDNGTKPFLLVSLHNYNYTTVTALRDPVQEKVEFENLASLFGN